MTVLAYFQMTNDWLVNVTFATF